MSQKEQSYEDRMDQLAREVEKLEIVLLGLTLEMTEKDVWWLLPRAVYAAHHLDLVRETLSKPPKGAESGGSTGPHDPPIVESGGGGLRKRRLTPFRRPGIKRG